MNIKAKQTVEGNNLVTQFEGQETATDYTYTQQIPNWLLALDNITPTQKLIYGFVYTFNTQNKEMFASNEFIASSLGLKIATVRYNLKEMETIGLIIRKVENHQRSYIQAVIPKAVQHFAIDESNKILGGGANGLAGGVLMGYQGDANGLAHTISITRSITKYNNIYENQSKTDKRDPDITALVDYLSEKQPLIDGTNQANRFQASNILKKLKKVYPGQDALQLGKQLIDVAMADSFHAANATNFGYIYRNMGKIINNAQKQSTNKLIVIS